MPKKLSGKNKFFAGLGRRKTASARVWLYDKKGEIFVNDMPIKEYFSQREQILTWVRPFHAIGVSHPPSKFSGTIKVAGGGKNGQVIAVQLGIARALLKYDESLKPLLKTGGFLTRDSREVERKKPFLQKARKRPQYSKR
ncbi:30S ribosomal protein S9 [candidate division WWE3 bacterium RIFCSPLOWO2_01_FULL_39_13]|uniref:30S ribosomal protein S9 n=1 Tax=candidate division WWE3 bacterium RIFCSPLOWO2_01_FULL_39_13 TaxID=1802624 RepID=A0A1F4V4M3_UNCKA|nr:MAG: 30S ribosomal protein S9 [candidate division WWE3 bacterium RIFCSPLOWO2_01_FULL_39_13]